MILILKSNSCPSLPFSNIRWGFSFQKIRGQSVYFPLEKDAISVPKVTYESACNALRCRVSSPHTEVVRPVDLLNLFLKVCYQISPLDHMKCESEKQDPVLKELGKLRFTNSKPVYSANFIIHALMLRYYSLSAYKLLLTEFNIPSISFLRKVISRKLNSIASAKILKDSGYWCSMKYICKGPRNSSGGETIGADETGDLYKVLMCFMIVGLKSNIPFVVRVEPETGLRWVASRRY